MYFMAFVTFWGDALAILRSNFHATGHPHWLIVLDRPQRLPLRPMSQWHSERDFCGAYFQAKLTAVTLASRMVTGLLVDFREL